MVQEMEKEKENEKEVYEDKFERMDEDSVTMRSNKDHVEGDEKGRGTT
jgi:hypothetical protein